MEKKTMDEMFISTINSISQIADLITSGNVSHYIANIKASCTIMIDFYNSEKNNHDLQIPTIDNEKVSELFELLTKRIRQNEVIDKVHSTLKKCNKEKASCCNACEWRVKHHCMTLDSMERNVSKQRDIDSEIAIFIESHGFTLAHLLGATRVNCESWLQERAKEHRKTCGESGYYNELLAKELNIKL